MNDEPEVIPNTEEGLRKQAVASLNRKRAFKQTLVAYVLVNIALVGIWALSGQGYFWPAWVIGGWGLGLAFQAWAAYGPRHEITEDEVSEEMSRLRGGGS